jgi:hypothetical protein
VNQYTYLLRAGELSGGGSTITNLVVEPGQQCARRALTAGNSPRLAPSIRIATPVRRPSFCTETRIQGDTWEAALRGSYSSRNSIP